MMNNERDRWSHIRQWDTEYHLQTLTVDSANDEHWLYQLISDQDLDQLVDLDLQSFKMLPPVMKYNATNLLTYDCKKDCILEWWPFYQEQGESSYEVGITEDEQ